MRRTPDAPARSCAAENQPESDARGPGATDGRASRRGAWYVAVVAGCLIALVSSATGFPPTSAFAVLEDTTTTSSTTSTTLLNPGEIDTSTGVDQVDSEVDGVKSQLNGVLDTIAGEGTGPRLPEEEEPPEDPDPPPPPEEPGTDDDDTPPDDGDDDDEKTPPPGEPEDEQDEEESPAPPRTRNSLTTLRTFDISHAVPIVEVSSPLGRFPFEGFVDIPLGPRTTRDVVDLLASLGISGEGLCEVLAPFPVCGPAKYSNDWNAPRHTPYFHPHQGTDIFAPRGTPIISPTDGVVQNLRPDTAVGGNSLRVVDASGGYTYFAHLEDFAPGIANGTIVRTGQVLGGVGDSGNAVGTPPHLHFEKRPSGEAVPPLPYLDQWLSQARAQAQQMAGIEPQSVPQTADTYSPFQAPVPPQAGIFEPAASHRDSPAATIALLLIIGAAVVAIRRRDTLLAPVRMAVAGVVPERFRRRLPARNLLTMPWELPEGDEAGTASRDVLAPLLRERERERERELETVGADR